jgi:hypothetical protein
MSQKNQTESITTVSSTIVPREKSRFLPSYCSHSMPLREVRLPILPPNFSLGSTVGIDQKQKSRVLPRDNCTGHCSIIMCGLITY